MKPYKLIISSWNVTTTIKVDLTKKEAELFRDINFSLIKQNAENIIDIEEI